jgi:tellurite resistance protein
MTPTMTGAAVQPAAERSLAHLPPALFTVPMSFVGIALVGRRSEAALGWGGTIGEAAFWLAVASLAVVALAYIAKLGQHPAAVLADWRHPTRMCFLAAGPMTLVLIAVALLPANASAALATWLLGTALYLAVMIGATNAWMRRAPIELTMLNPVWFLPIAGPILIVHAGPRLGFVELSWLILSASVLAWIALQTLLFYRLVFMPPLPERLAPSQTIQIGPAPLIFIGLCELVPGLDGFGRILYNSGLAIAVMLAPRLLIQARPFLTWAQLQMGWWAYSFPLSALAAATFLYAERAGSPAHNWLGGAIFALVTAITLVLAARTLQATFRGDLLKPES